MKYMRLLEHKWHSVNSSDDDSDDQCLCCPGRAPVHGRCSINGL